MKRRAGPRVAAFNCPNCGAAVAHDAVSCRYCGSAVATRVCPACFGAVAIGMRHCPHCGAQAAEGESKPVDLRCPRCESALSEAPVGKHSLHQCLRCGGLWADKESFQDICAREQEQEAVLGFEVKPETSSSPLQPSKPQRTYVPCPICGKLMNHKNFSGCSGVVIDWCREHGTWFDRRELHDIVAFIRNGGLRKARERDQAKLKDRESELRMREFQAAALDRRANSTLGDLDLEGNRTSLLELFCSSLFR